MTDLDNVDLLLPEQWGVVVTADPGGWSSDRIIRKPEDITLPTLRVTSGYLEDFVRTIFSRYWPVLSHLRPTYSLPSVHAIDDSFLDREGVELVIWDIDGTLMAYHAKAIDASFTESFTRLLSTPHRQHAILSNCDERRFDELGSILPDVPILRAYQHRNRSDLRVKLRGQDTHTSNEVGRLLADGGRHIRKPSADLIPLAAEHFRIQDHSRILMVGDQYLTDIATASLGGARSAKVPAIHRDTFPRRIRFTQRLEKALFMLLYGARSSNSGSE